MYSHHVYTTQEEDTATPDGFFDMICKYQSQRLDEQRASLPSRSSHTPRSVVPANTYKKNSDDDQLLEMLYKVQHSRLNEQRCEMPSAPHLISRMSGHCSQQHDDDVESDDVSSEEEDEEEEEDPAEAEEKRDHLHALPQVYTYTHTPNHCM